MRKSIKAIKNKAKHIEMKINQPTLKIILILLISISISPSFSQEWKYDNDSFEVVKFIKMGYKNIPKKARKYFEGMKYIEGGTFVMGNNDPNIELKDKDSTFIFIPNASRVTVSSFFISDHEVTNAEYREFVNWVIHKTALQILAKYDSNYVDENGKIREDLPIDFKNEILIEHLFLTESERFYRRKEIDVTKLFYDLNMGDETIQISVYPDTLCWVKDYSFSFNDPMVKLYFSHPGYDDYPVVGVNYWQAQAYCHWRTNRLNEDILLAEKIIKNRSYFFNSNDFMEENASKGILYPNFRLPTEAEWEYAANGKPDEKSYRSNRYHWGNYELRDEKGKYYANFGRMLDENGVWLKSFQDDGAFYTNKVKSYPQNNFSIYDMSGNAAEWVMDVYTRREDSFVMKINVGDNKQIAFTKMYNSLIRSNDGNRYDSISDRYYIERFANQELHNAKVYENMKPARIVKGGSWADGPLYLTPRIRTAYQETRGSSRIGFRVSMSLVGSIKKE